MFLSPRRPKQIEFARQLIKVGCLKRKEIMYAIIDVYKVPMIKAKDRYQKALEDLLKHGYTVAVNSVNFVRAWKDNI